MTLRPRTRARKSAKAEALNGLAPPTGQPMRIYRLNRNTDRQRLGQFGWGGNLRNEQIRDAVESGGMELVDVHPGGVFSRFARLRAWIRLSRAPTWRAKPDLKMQSYLAGHYCAFAELFRGLGPGGVFILEEPLEFPVYYAARDFGWNLVVTPTCLESLWPNYADPFSGLGLPDSLELELAHLRLAASVFFISREEQWLAANRGLASGYLPYYPPSSQLEQLNADRARRARVADRPLEFLVMGTASNSNAISGFREQAVWIVNALQGLDARVHVVGAGTEKLRDVWSDPLFEFHGLTPPDKLSEIKARVRACLLHFVQGHGALTRIPDMLVSGVPVVANAIACRSAWTYAGVHCYDDQAMLKQLLTSVDGMAPAPPPPETQIRIFQQTLRRLHGRMPATIRSDDGPVAPAVVEL